MPENEELQSLSRLEERILETVRQLKAAREENRGLRQRVVELEEERRQILERVERLLNQIDTLTQG
jgi:predicted  nucleic acid-binding Zn-ribbon protein